MRRRNPLLARPPRSLHRLSGVGERRARAQLQDAYADAYSGVHTTPLYDLASLYADSAAKQGSSPPVVLALGMAGLTPEPDVDAHLQEEAVIDALRDALRGGALEEPWFDRDSSAVDTVAEAVQAALYDTDPVRAVFSLVDDDPDEAAAVAKAVLGGDDALMRALLLEMFPQRRYLVDIPFDRLVSIRQTVPYLDELVTSYPGDGVDDDDDRYRRASRGRLEVYHTEDAFDRDDFLKYTTLLEYAPLARASRVEYHGTTWDVLRLAFGTSLPKGLRPRYRGQAGR